MLEMISCECKTETSATNRCQCHLHQLKCLYVCGFLNCSNQFEGDENAITDNCSGKESGMDFTNLKVTVRLSIDMGAVSCKC